MVVVPTKRVFAAWEHLGFSVTYRNASKRAFRLPDQPGGYNYWQMNLTRADTDQAYTGRSSLPMGLAMSARPTAPWSRARRSPSRSSWPPTRIRREQHGIAARPPRNFPSAGTK